jgi:DNA-binding transcriptional regulator WhiA
MCERQVEAFVVGAALGDGNLSNPNGRAVRLRITCDSKYTNLINEIRDALVVLFPKNKVALVLRKDNCVDVSVYSNQLITMMPWKVNNGTKYDQQARVPSWIFTQKMYAQECLRGLILSDGSIYRDRKYVMINICTNIKILAKDILELASILGFEGKLYVTNQPSGKPKFTIRFSKNTEKMLQKLHIQQKS